MTISVASAWLPAPTSQATSTFLRCSDPVETQNLASPSKQMKELPVKPISLGSTGNLDIYGAINR